MHLGSNISNSSLKRRLQQSGAVPVFSKVFPSGVTLSQTPNADRVRNLMAVEYNQYQSSSPHALRTYKITLLLIVSVLLVFVGVNMWVLDYTPPKYYCTGKYLKGNFEETNCTPCPPDSTCLNGSIVECHREKILIDNECMENFPEAILQKRMRAYLSNYLAEQRGNAVCGYSKEDAASIILTQIDSVLQPQFGKVREFPIAMVNLKSELKNGPFDFPEHIAVLPKTNLADESLTSLRATLIKRPFLCKLLTVLELHPWPLFFLIVGFVYIVLRLQSAVEEVDNIKRAENLYKCLLALIRVERKIKASDLFEFLPEGLNFERRARILGQVQEILIADKQVSLTFENNEDYYVGN